MKRNYILFSCDCFSDPLDQFTAHSLLEAADICRRKYACSQYALRPSNWRRTSVEYAVMHGKTQVDTYRLEEK